MQSTHEHTLDNCMHPFAGIIGPDGRPGTPGTLGSKGEAGAAGDVGPVGPQGALVDILIKMSNINLFSGRKGDSGKNGIPGKE
jgi:hypothetical protein